MNIAQAIPSHSTANRSRNVIAAKSAAILFALALFTGLRLHGQVTETYVFSGLNRTIPDGGIVGVNDVRMLTSAVRRISTVRIYLRVQGEFNGDLYGYVRHIHGNLTNFCVLLNRPGMTTARMWGYDDAGLDVLFDDSAANGDIHTYQRVVVPSLDSPLDGVWQPDGRNVNPAFAFDYEARTTTLNSFAGADASGEWTLFLADLESGGTNMLAEWRIEAAGAVQPQITWSPAGPVVYGTPLGSGQLNALARFNGTDVPGNFSYSPPSGTVLNAGAGQSLSTTFIPSDANSFLTVSGSITFDVSRAPLTVTAHDATRAYGQANPPLTGDTVGVQNGDALDASFVTLADATSLPGTYSITPVLADPGSRLGNYNVTATPGTLTITNPGPRFSAIPDYVINEGSTFTLNINAFVSVVPTDVLAFSLGGGSPAAATIESGTGLLTWEPSSSFASTTNTITVKVTNNTAPPLGDVATFRVIVVAKPRLLDMSETSDGVFALKWQVYPGASYRLQYKDSLLDSEWTPSGSDFVADATVASTVNNAGTNTHRIYRLLQIGTPNP